MYSRFQITNRLMKRFLLTETSTEKEIHILLEISQLGLLKIYM
jgi:hypothetical protein